MFASEAMCRAVVFLSLGVHKAGRVVMACVLGSTSISTFSIVSYGIVWCVMIKCQT